MTEKSEEKHWTKVNAIAQISSSLLIGILGILATIMVNRWQNRASENQLDLQKAIAADQISLSTKQAADQQQTSRQQFTQQQALAERQFLYQQQLDAARAKADAGAKIASYVTQIESTIGGYDQKAALVKAIDSVTDPQNAVLVAFRYAYPNKNENAWSNEVANAALDVLKRERINGREQLRAISRNTDVNVDSFIRSQMATGLISGHDRRLFIRVSDVKSGAAVSLNGNRIDMHRDDDNQDSGWVEVTKRLIRGPNEIELFVSSGGEAGDISCGAHFQVSAGTQQYDRFIALRHCPPVHPSYRTTFPLELEPQGDIVLNRAKTFIEPGLTPSNCVRECDPMETDPSGQP